MANFYYQPQSAVSSRVISLPFNFTAAGYVATVDSSSAEAWRNKIATLLMTGRGTRVWYDKYGASLSDLLLFENQQDATAMLSEAIADAIALWTPELSLVDTVYNYDANTGTLTVTVIYRLPDGTEDKIVLKQESVTTSGDALQVIWNG